MMGYYHMPEETAQTLEDGWLKTGDLGYVDEDGFVFITGRKKNLIILANGENVSPEELENRLLKNNLIKEIIVSEYPGGIQAEVFPDEEYAKKKRIRDITAAIQEIIDDFNQGMPVFKRISRLSIRDTEFEKRLPKRSNVLNSYNNMKADFQPFCGFENLLFSCALFRNISDAVQDQTRTVRILFDIFPSHHAGEYEYRVQSGFNTCNDIGIHAVADDRGIFGVNAQHPKPCTHHQRIRLADVVCRFPGRQLYGSYECAAGGDDTILRRSGQIIVRADQAGAFSISLTACRILS